MSNTPDKPSLEDVLKEFEALPPVPETEIEKLAAANRALDNDPEFLTEVQQASVTNQLRTALEDSGESQTSFAARWGKTRQYVSKFLGEKLTNYTIETITHAAYHLGLRITVKVHRPDQVVVVRPLPRGAQFSIPRIAKPKTVSTDFVPFTAHTVPLDYAGKSEERALAA